MTIYLIRHGNTIANEKHLYCGKTDLPLSESGRTELRPVEPVPADARFISSGLRRCDETLEYLFGDIPYEKIQAFQEMDFGAFEMKSYEELKRDPDYQRWITGDNERNVTPGGESGAQMCSRALEAFGQILAAGRDAVIVTHGGVIAAVMAQLFPEEQKNRYQWQPRPGGGYVLTNGRYRPIPEVRK